MMRKVGDFFDEHADEYHSLPDAKYRRFHVITARVLIERGFDPTVHRIQAPDVRASDLMRPVIGLPWLEVPRILYPLRTVLIEATKT